MFKGILATLQKKTTPTTNKGCFFTPYSWGGNFVGVAKLPLICSFQYNNTLQILYWR